jgi:hypothetical protein
MITPAARYIYLGDRLTDPTLRGMLCNPVRNEQGKCIISVPMATALVEDLRGNRFVVLRRRLRLTKGEQAQR